MIEIFSAVLMYACSVWLRVKLETVLGKITVAKYLSNTLARTLLDAKSSWS